MQVPREEVAALVAPGRRERRRDRPPQQARLVVAGRGVRLEPARRLHELQTKSAPRAGAQPAVRRALVEQGQRNLKSFWRAARRHAQRLDQRRAGLRPEALGRLVGEGASQVGVAGVDVAEPRARDGRGGRQAPRRFRRVQRVAAVEERRGGTRARGVHGPVPRVVDEQRVDGSALVLGQRRVGALLGAARPRSRWLQRPRWLQNAAFGRMSAAAQRMRWLCLPAMSASLDVRESPFCECCTAHSDWKEQ